MENGRRDGYLTHLEYEYVWKHTRSAPAIPSRISLRPVRNISSRPDVKISEKIENVKRSGKVREGT
jgi:hypothetical protein